MKKIQKKMLTMYLQFEQSSIGNELSLPYNKKKKKINYSSIIQVNSKTKNELVLSSLFSFIFIVTGIHSKRDKSQ